MDRAERGSGRRAVRRRRKRRLVQPDRSRPAGEPAGWSPSSRLRELRGVMRQRGAERLRGDGHALPVVLSDRTGLADLVYRSIEPGAAGARAPPDACRRIASRLSFRLDDLVSQIGLPAPTLLQVDVGDGAEAPVLAGAPLTLVVALRLVGGGQARPDREVVRLLAEAGLVLEPASGAGRPAAERRLVRNLRALRPSVRWAAVEDPAGRQEHRQHADDLAGRRRARRPRAQPHDRREGGEVGGVRRRAQRLADEHPAVTLIDLPYVFQHGWETCARPQAGHRLSALLRAPLPRRDEASGLGRAADAAVSPVGRRDCRSQEHRR